MATGKHYRGNTTASRQTRKEVSRSQYSRSQANRQSVRTAQPDPYEDLYSYEEPRGAKRGTRQAARTTAYMPAKQKSGIAAPLIAVLCLLGAAGIMVYMLWDLGVVDMLLSVLK